MDIRQILDKVAEMHPYKVVGDADSYSDYAQGWTDAVNEIDSLLPTQMSGTSELATNLQSTCNDAISRQALCEYALNQKDKSVTPNDIMRFPSAQPERKIGKWIVHIGMNHECSSCNHFFPLSSFKGRPFEINYCPNCGADMRGGSE